MRRREFIALLSGVAGWPLATRAQQSALPVIGFLSSASPELSADRLRGFRRGLKEAGYVEGENVAIDYRWAEDQYDRLSVLAAELVHRRVSVIVAVSTRAALAAKAATATIPIVFGAAGDPVELGLVASLNRPGGNLTGVSNLHGEVGPKRLELLHEVVPRATIMAVVVNPTFSSMFAGRFVRRMQAAARTLALELHVLHASTESELATVFATLVEIRAGALVIGPDAFFVSRTEQLAALTLRYAVPAIFQYRQFAAAGGLMSYGASLTEYYGLAGIYTGQILKGAKPSDLPVQQSTKLEFIINLKTAKILGLTVPLMLLDQADEVIE